MIKTLLASCAFAIIATTASAEVECRDTKTLYDILSKVFNEERQFSGIKDDKIVEMWSNSETGSWSMVLTDPRGASCIALHGSDYERHVKGNV